MEICRLEANEFQGSARWDGEAVRVTLTGTADLTSRHGLRLLLQDVRAATRISRPREAILDLRGVRFMNSSCIATLLGWTNAVANDDRGNQYTIRILWDPDVGWERRSLSAIAAVAAGVIQLDPCL